jgi:hypothetical protein
MKRKVAPIGLLAVMLAAALFLWMVLPAPTAYANTQDGVGEWSIDTTPPPTNHGTSNDDGDPGYDADPDTFQIDSWAGAELEPVVDTRRLSRGWPVGGQFGWLLSWLLVVLGSRSMFWGSGS